MGGRWERVLTLGGVFREIRGDGDTWCEDDERTVVDGSGRHNDCDIEDSPTEPSPPDETDVFWEDGDKTIVVTAEEHESHAIMDPPVEESPTNPSILNWADEVNESCQDDCKTPVANRKGHEASTASSSPVPKTLINASLPSPISASSPTWAEVAASPVKNQTHDSKHLENWGDVSGKSWEWERNWR